MIKPHGSDVLHPLYVSDAVAREHLLKEAETLPSLLLNSAAAANAVMLGAGYFNPLQGYMNLADALSVAENMHTTDGLFWPVPVVNLTQDTGITAGARLALRDPNAEGHPILAVMDVTNIEVVPTHRLPQWPTKFLEPTMPATQASARLLSLEINFCRDPFRF
mgnify:CR=1 FL=1